MEQDRMRWDERYADRVPARAAPPDVLSRHSDVADLVPRTGRALDVACGAGAQTLWLAERGLDVVALDVSPVAIGLVCESAAAAQVEASVDARVHDTDDGLPDDLASFDVIVCQRYRVPSLYGEFVQRLQPCGVLVLTVLSAAGLGGTPGAFHAPPGELSEAFRRDDVRVLVDEEGDGEASVVVQRVS